MTQDTTNAATNPSSSTSTSLEITAETSTRVCKHMNEDHGLSVYAMAARCVTLPDAGWKITSAKMKKVTPQGCELQAVTCSGDMCEMKSVTYPFTPPLTSASEIKPRIVAIHHQVLSPEWIWLYTKPFAFKILLVVGVISYGTLVLGQDGMIKFLDSTTLIKQFYPKTNYIATLVRIAFYVSSVAHLFEATFAAYICQKTLKLNWKGTLKWMIMVFLAGNTIFTELQTFRKIQLQNDKEKESKTS